MTVETRGWTPPQEGNLIDIVDMVMSQAPPPHQVPAASVDLVQREPDCYIVRKARQHLRSADTTDSDSENERPLEPGSRDPLEAGGGGGTPLEASGQPGGGKDGSQATEEQELELESAGPLTEEQESARPPTEEQELESAGPLTEDWRKAGGEGVGQEVLHWPSSAAKSCSWATSPLMRSWRFKSTTFIRPKDPRSFEATRNSHWVHSIIGEVGRYRNGPKRRELNKCSLMKNKTVKTKTQRNQEQDTKTD
ncbi:hypothetical protein D5F01_LYC02120 [Larimichthys crocea]|uniref:Uncharacterized protein n=1 Tax=Larimichthys crocea TaxID=215358 RepID=A0A6G0J7Y0_LARCR|nr:hypothetical protein D5F01_LYC02120 [Larimichthys crocea]